MSIWEFNLPIKLHNLIGLQYWELSQEVLLSMATNGKDWMGKSRLLDCILICIANWTVVLSSFTRSIIKSELFVLPWWI